MNNNNFQKELDIFNVSLKGIKLIEASAGTGKTFTIILLYLRLLLGIGKNKNRIKKLLVNEILVVTFTNAAKEELHIRIKNGIQNLYLTCINKNTSDPIFKLFLTEIEDIEDAIHTLQIAQNNINDLSIYTIHGFCQQILQSYTFHFNHIFQEKIIENEDNLYLQATQDFWRHYFYDLPEDIIKIIYKDYNHPKILLKKIKPFLNIKSINFKNKFFKKKTLIVCHEENIKKIDSFKETWLIHYSIALNKINQLKINKKIYNEFNISRWIIDITKWAQSETKDYTIPLSLKYFAKNKIQDSTVNRIGSNYIIFEETEKFLKKTFSLKNIIIFYAIKNIPKLLLKEKEKKSLIGFSDLLSILLKTIKKEKSLKNLISERYPAAFIDEFQDTDLEQYEMFNIIYENNKKTTLFLIGDPKQAIYSFRGADIFSYLYAKSKIKKHYYLNTNWRSSVHMCNSINFLFSQHKNPFIFKNILFQPSISSSKNLKMSFKINNNVQAPLKFFLQEKEESYIDDYQYWIAKQCANQISYWLSCAQKGEAKITTKNGERILNHDDIAILVRNKKEAYIIQNALIKVNISSKYSSHKNSVFQTFDAQELLWILESIFEPKNEKFLKQSLSSDILQKLLFRKKQTSKDINSYFIIEKLYEYRKMWQKIGIFHMVRTMILEYQEHFKSLNIDMDYQKNFNFLHIAELLEEQFEFLDKKKSLIRWFQKKVSQKKQPLYNEYIRYFDNSESVKIVTIHKSKGLEYPIVWIPFSVNFNRSKLPLYHDKKNFKMFFDIKESKKSLKKSDEERLAEDLRLLYVGLTRSILHCSIGIACLMKKKIKNKKNSDIHESALGYIIQDGKSMNYIELFKKLHKLRINNIIDIQSKTTSFKLPINKKIIYLIPKYIEQDKKIKNVWNITSFTKLNQENQLNNFNDHIIKKISIQNKLKKTNKNLTVHNFPKGTKTGLLMHYILKKSISFEKKKDWFSKILKNNNISLKWLDILISWTKNILNTPLNIQKIILSKLKNKSYTTELEFFLPIKNILCSIELNKIMQSYDAISTLSPKLIFNPVTGILKGFIDLIFIWKKKYYILDYKTNWLGKDNHFYSEKNIKKEIIKHRYDLQYQIYTLAIDQYLKTKIKNYKYQTHFGGVFYFFLRAIGDSEKNNGIFYTIPDYLLIKKLMILILNKK